MIWFYLWGQISDLKEFGHLGTTYLYILSFQDILINFSECRVDAEKSFTLSYQSIECAPIISSIYCNSFLLYSIQTIFFSNHMTINSIKKRNQDIINITANRKNTPTTVNIELIYSLSGAKQFRFLYIVIWLKETLLECRRWHQRESNPHLLIRKQTSNHLKALKWRE